MKTKIKTFADETTGQLQKLGLIATSNTWLPSHYVFVTSSSSNFGVYDVQPNMHVYSDVLFDVESDGSTSVYGVVCLIRPVFLLASNVKITGGNGTSDNPYELGI